MTRRSGDAARGRSAPVTVLDDAGAAAFARCLASGGVAVFPADTVYGLACAPDAPEAVAPALRAQGPPAGEAGGGAVLRPRARPRRAPGARAAHAGAARAGCCRAGSPRCCRIRSAASRSPARADPLTLGCASPRCPRRWRRWRACAAPVLQSSANVAGGPDARRLDDVPEAIRAGADLVLDGGELPGTPSTVVDLRRYEAAGEWAIVREGAVPAAAIAPPPAEPRGARRARVDLVPPSATGRRSPPRLPPGALLRSLARPPTAPGDRHGRPAARLLRAPARRRGPRGRRGGGGRARAPAADARDDRVGELRARGGPRVPGQRAHQQVRRGLSGQAVLRRLRARRRDRAARHRPGEGAVRGGARERPAARGRPGQRGRLPRAAPAGRDDHGPRAAARRPPDATA